jgi:hypothetical protein
VTANPWEAAISADGRQFYVVFAGTDDMFACDVVDDDYHESHPTDQAGPNPWALRVTPSGQTLYVSRSTSRRGLRYEVARAQQLSSLLNPWAKKNAADSVYATQQPMVGRRRINVQLPSRRAAGQPTWHNPEGRDTQ